MIDWTNRKEMVRVAKFAIVGGLNTLITLAAIWALMKFFSFGYITANVCGYVAGIVNSFVWSKLWVFKVRHTRRIGREMLLFALACLVAYSIQFCFLYVMVEYVSIDKYLAQLLGMIVYGFANFIMNRMITFVDR